MARPGAPGRNGPTIACIAFASIGAATRNQFDIMKRALKLLAPYVAVGVCWCIFSNAWLAILSYHAQVLFWSRKSLCELRRPNPRRIALLALPTVVAGPLVYFLLPYITHESLPAWLANYHLTGVSFIVMIPYFGLIHPFLEELHWSGLRESTGISHFVFAGYHMIVLHSLLTVPWLMLCFVVLVSASFMWQQLGRHGNSLTVPVISHVLADASVIIAAWLRT